MQQTGFFQNAQHKDKQFAVYLQRQMPPDAAQGGVIGHGFSGGKAQESPQGQGIASCAGRCRAQSRCPQNSRSKTCGKSARRDGPAAEFVGGEWSAQLFGEGVKCFLMQELLQSLVQDLPLTLGQLIIQKPHALLLCLPPAKTHDAPPTQFDHLGTIMPCLESFSTGCYVFSAKIL